MSLRSISADQITKVFIDAIGEIYCQPQAEILDLLKSALDREKDEVARDMLDTIIENAEIGARDKVPVCQDTGLVIVFARLGVDAHIEGGCLQDILDSAASAAWDKYFLRRSVAEDPLLYRQKPTKDKQVSDIESPFPLFPFCPVILHLEQVPGNTLILDIALKGGGAENMSTLRMFNPTATPDEVEKYIVDTVVSAGGNPCPPVIVGVGIGGDFELCAVLAKKALIVPAEKRSVDDPYLRMEERILESINQLGKGVQGFAGATTALEVRILTAPCHIASLPVAVNIECHSHRCTSREI